MRKVKMTESEMLRPVLRLFPRKYYKRFPQVALGRKKIDLLCVPKQARKGSVAVELKLENWPRALWQALNNFQVAEQSYVAVWHEYVHRVERHLSLLDQYGVGLIAVGPRSARVIRGS